MTNELGLVLGYLSGSCSIGLFGWRIHRRMCWRLVRNQIIENKAKDIETRRYPTEFVNQDEPRLGVGPAGEEHHMFSVRPGALMLAKLAEKNAEKT